MRDDDLRYLKDRMEIRDVAQTYARGADRRDPALVASMFTPDGRLVPHHEPGTPPVVRSGREEIAKALTGLERYLATTHLVVNQLVDIDGDRARGETYCMAHHIYEKDGVRRDRVVAIRYHDDYVRTPDGWRIETRTLDYDWVEDRPLTI